MSREFLQDTLAGTGPRFIAVGILNTAIGYGTFYLLLWSGYHYLVAITVSNIVAVSNSYLWNRRWTVRSSGSPTRELPKFLAVYGVIYVISCGLMALLVEIGKIPPALAALGVLIITTVISFLGHKFWSFRA